MLIIHIAATIYMAVFLLLAWIEESECYHENWKSFLPLSLNTIAVAYLVIQGWVK